MIACVGLGLQAFSQDTTDAHRLKQFLKGHENIDCDVDSIRGMTSVERICLNREFQKVDSALNSQVRLLMDELSIFPDSILQKQHTLHQSWVMNRQEQCIMISWGAPSYLHCMVNMTKRRIGEIEYLRKFQ